MDQTLLEPPAATVRDVYGSWEKLRRFTRSWRLERARLQPFLRIAGDRPAISITPEVWSDIVAQRMTELLPRTKKRPSDTTLDMELTRAKQMLKWAWKSGRIQSNPLADAKGSGRVGRRETWLNWPQVEQLLSACAGNDALHAWVLVAVSTGMRISETLTLRHDRIAGNGTVTIASAQTKSKRKRIVALSPRAIEAVAALPRHFSSPFVFWTPRTGKPLHHSTIERWFRVAVERAKLDYVCAYGDGKLRPHDLRHTHASLADAAGASPTAIRDQLGHADLRTTERYLHRKQEDRALEMAALMDRRPAKRAVTTETETTSKKVENFS